MQRVRRRPERGALRFRDLVLPKPLGPNRIRRLGYYRPCCRWATEARGTRSAFTHVLTEARLPEVLNQHLPHTDYLTLAVGGCIYPFCSVRTNRCSAILRVCCREGGKTASLRWRCVAAMKHDPLHHVTAAHTRCMSSDPLFCASQLIKLVASTVC